MSRKSIREKKIIVRQTKYFHQKGCTMLLQFTTLIEWSICKIIKLIIFNEKFFNMLPEKFNKMACYLKLLKESYDLNFNYDLNF